MGFPCASLAVTVSVVVLVPSAVSEAGAAARVVVVLLRAPATNDTVVVTLTAPSVAVTVLLSALVEASVAVKTPEALLLPEVGVRVLPVPVLASDPVWPLMRFPCASLTVTVSAVVLVPSAVTMPGAALTDEVLLLGAPA